MDNTPNPQVMLNITREILASEGNVAIQNRASIEEIMNALAATRDIQAVFNQQTPPLRSGFINNLKNKFLGVFRNMIVNSMEKTVRRQQQFNELTYQAISHLKAEVDAFTNSDQTE